MLVGQEYTLTLSGFGYTEHNEETLDIDIAALIEQTQEAALDLITANDMRSEINLENGLGYEVSDKISIESVHEYITEDGENAVSFVTTQESSENRHSYQNLFLRVKDSTSPIHTMSWNNNDFNGTDIILGDYTLDDLEFVLNTSEFSSISDEVVEFTFTVPDVQLPTLSAQPDLEVPSNFGPVFNISHVDVNPLQINIVGSFEGDSSDANQVADTTVEILYHDGSSTQASVRGHGQSYSMTDGDTIINFDLKVSQENDLDIIDVENISGILINGELVEF